MRVVRRISAVIIGFVFFIAGILKLMDPVGASLLVEEYLKFFHLAFLRPTSYFLGYALPLLETITGAALITGVWKKITAIVSGSLIAAFTIITAILLIFKANFDCGCFGEAVKLTHLQSLLKNLALLALWAISFLPFSSAEPTRKIKYVSFSVACISVFFFTLYSAFSVPMMDFTPFKPGAELMESTSEILDTELPWDNSHNETLLSFSDASGQYADSLALQEKVMIISVYNPEKVKPAQWTRIEAFLARSEAQGFAALLLMSYGYDEPPISSALQSYCYFADRRTLMTLNRANGGASYLSNAQVIAKWGAAKLPRSEDLQKIANTDSSETLIELNRKESLKMQGFLLYVFAILLLL